MQTAQPASTNKLSMGCGYVVMIVLLVAGVGLLGLAANNYDKAGHRPTAVVIVPTVIGGLLVLGAGLYLRLARRLVQESAAEAARRAQFPDQPWKWKKEWQVPFIVSESGASAAGLWIFAIFWNAISVPATWIVLHDPSAKKGALVILLFPLVGVGVLWGAIYQTIRWRKFGRARFVPSTMPGAIGGYLGGVIEVPARVLPEADARLALKCVRRETRGSGKNRRTSDVVLWEHEETIARDKWITGAGGTRIPVLFYVPATCTATDDRDSNNEIVWRLSADAAVPGVDFAVQFKVPVYVTGEAAPAPAPGAPLLEEYSTPVLDGPALLACGVRREGDTFYFGASHLPGTRVVTAVLQLGLFGLLGWFCVQSVPGIVWAITLFFGLILSLFTASVWFDQYELRLEAADVVVTKPRPWGTTVNRVARAEVVAVKPARAMSSGENQYFSLSLVGAPGANPGGPGQAGEPFLVRKLRHQLEQQAKQGQISPEKIKELEARIGAELGATPKFKVQFAAHIPGQTKADAIGAMVLAAIKGKD